MDKGKTSVAMTAFGSLTLAVATLGNLGHCLFTLWVCIEQVQTGWGYGTGMEMAAIVPLLMEMLCIPAILGAAVFFLLHIKWKAPKWLVTANAAVYTLLLLQVGVFQLFLYY